MTVEAIQPQAIEPDEVTPAAAPEPIALPRVMAPPDRSFMGAKGLGIVQRHRMMQSALAREGQMAKLTQMKSQATKDHIAMQTALRREQQEVEDQREADEVFKRVAKAKTRAEALIIFGKERIKYAGNKQISDAYGRFLEIESEDEVYADAYRNEAERDDAEVKAGISKMAVGRKQEIIATAASGVTASMNEAKERELRSSAAVARVDKLIAAEDAETETKMLTNQVAQAEAKGKLGRMDTTLAADDAEEANRLAATAVSGMETSLRKMSVGSAIEMFGTTDAIVRAQAETEKIMAEAERGLAPEVAANRKTEVTNATLDGLLKQMQTMFELEMTPSQQEVAKLELARRMEALKIQGDINKVEGVYQSARAQEADLLAKIKVESEKLQGQVAIAEGSERLVERMDSGYTVLDSILRDSGIELSPADRGMMAEALAHTGFDQQNAVGLQTLLSDMSKPETGPAIREFVNGQMEALRSPDEMKRNIAAGHIRSLIRSRQGDHQANMDKLGRGIGYLEQRQAAARARYLSGQRDEYYDMIKQISAKDFTTKTGWTQAWDYHDEDNDPEKVQQLEAHPVYNQLVTAWRSVHGRYTKAEAEKLEDPNLEGRYKNIDPISGRPVYPKDGRENGGGKIYLKDLRREVLREMGRKASTFDADLNQLQQSGGVILPSSGGGGKDTDRPPADGDL